MALAHQPKGGISLKFIGKSDPIFFIDNFSSDCLKSMLTL